VQTSQSLHINSGSTPRASTVASVSADIHRQLCIQRRSTHLSCEAWSVTLTEIVGSCCCSAERAFNIYRARGHRSNLGHIEHNTETRITQQ